MSTSKSHLFAWATPHTIPPQSRINPSKLSAEEKHQQKTYVIFTRWRCCFCCFCFGCCSCAIGSIDGQSFGWVSAVFSTTRPRTCHRDSLRDKYLYSLFYLGFAFSNVLLASELQSMLSIFWNFSKLQKSHHLLNSCMTVQIFKKIHVQQ